MTVTPRRLPFYFVSFGGGKSAVYRYLPYEAGTGGGRTMLYKYIPYDVFVSPAHQNEEETKRRRNKNEEKEDRVKRKSLATLERCDGGKQNKKSRHRSWFCRERASVMGVSGEGG